MGMHPWEKGIQDLSSHKQCLRKRNLPDTKRPKGKDEAMAITGTSVAEQIAEAEKRLAEFNKENAPEPGSAEEADALEAAAMEVSPAQEGEIPADNIETSPPLYPAKAEEEIKIDTGLPVNASDEQVLDVLVKRRDALSVELDSKIKMEAALNVKIRDMKIPQAIANGLFAEASWALDIAKTGEYTILYSIPHRHTKLTKYLDPRLVRGLCTIKFDGLVLQFTNNQILLFGESDDEVMIDWIKEHKLRINIGMCAEAAGIHKKAYNRLMAAIRMFKDQDGTNVEDRKDEAMKAIKPELPVKSTAGQVRTIPEEDDGTEWGDPYPNQAYGPVPPHSYPHY